MQEYNSYKAVTKSDTVNVYPDGTLFDALWVGGSAPGDVAVVDQAGNPTVFQDVPPGTVLPVRGIRVNSSGSGAMDVVALRHV